MAGSVLSFFKSNFQKPITSWPVTKHISNVFYRKFTVGSELFSFPLHTSLSEISKIAIKSIAVGCSASFLSEGVVQFASGESSVEKLALDIIMGGITGAGIAIYGLIQSSENAQSRIRRVEMFVSTAANIAVLAGVNSFGSIIRGQSTAIAAATLMSIFGEGRFFRNCGKDTPLYVPILKSLGFSTGCGVGTHFALQYLADSVCKIAAGTFVIIGGLEALDPLLYKNTKWV